LQNVKYICHIVKHTNLIKMENQQNFQPKFRLLPNYFKKIGIGFVLFAFIILIPLFHYWKTLEFAGNYKQFFYVPFFDILILGLLLYSMAKEKIEDELIVLIRLQSIAKAFIVGIFFVIGWQLGEFWNDYIQEIKGSVFQSFGVLIVIICILISYILTFNSMKKKM